MTNNIEQRLGAIENQLDVIARQLQGLTDAGQPMADLKEELGPIAAEVMKTSIDQLAHLEQRGYFAFARELLYLLERVVEDYDPQDLHELADNAANILDTVRAATQPTVLAVLRDLIDAFEDGRKPEPVGVMGAWRKVRRDKNVQRGLSFSLDVLGRVGRAVSRAPRMSRKALRAVPAAGRRVAARLVEGPVVDAAPSAAAPVASQSGPPDPDVFITDAQWTRETSLARAQALGFADLSEEQWELVDCVRREFKTNGSTPNIRRLTHVSGCSTREIYARFPRAPGLTLAKIACVPKPKGCL